MKNTFRVAACLVLAAAGSSHAALVTFEPDDFATILDNGATHSVQGFDFTLESGNSDGFFISGFSSPDYVNNGSKNLFAANYASLAVAASNGAAFDLASFRLGGGYIDSPETWASSVVAVGRTADGATLVKSFALPQTSVMAVATLGWSNLKSFELLPDAHVGSIYNARDFTIDDISVTTAVPEPQSVALMLAGLGVLGWTARRRRNT